MFGYNWNFIEYFSRITKPLNVTMSRTTKRRGKRRRKSCHSIYEREEGASYTPIAKPFLHSHPSAFGGAQLLHQTAHCTPARPWVRCCFSVLASGNVCFVYSYSHSTYVVLEYRDR